MSMWERAVQIATIGTFLIVVVGGLWFGGGEWRYIKDKIEWLVSENRDISLEVTAVRKRMEAIESANAQRRSGATIESPDTTPQFAPEWSPRR